MCLCVCVSMCVCAYRTGAAHTFTLYLGPPLVGALFYVFCVLCWRCVWFAFRLLKEGRGAVKEEKSVEALSRLLHRSCCRFIQCSKYRAIESNKTTTHPSLLAICSHRPNAATFLTGRKVSQAHHQLIFSVPRS